MYKILSFTLYSLQVDFIFHSYSGYILLLLAVEVPYFKSYTIKQYIYDKDLDSLKLNSVIISVNIEIPKIISNYPWKHVCLALSLKKLWHVFLLFLSCYSLEFLYFRQKLRRECVLFLFTALAWRTIHNRWSIQLQHVFRLCTQMFPVQDNSQS